MINKETKNIHTFCYRCKYQSEEKIINDPFFENVMLITTEYCDKCNDYDEVTPSTSYYDYELNSI